MFEDEDDSEHVGGMLTAAMEVGRRRESIDKTSDMRVPVRTITVHATPDSVEIDFLYDGRVRAAVALPVATAKTLARYVAEKVLLLEAFHDREFMEANDQQSEFLKFMADRADIHGEHDIADAMRRAAHNTAGDD